MIRKNLIIASIACLICVSTQAQENYTLERCKQLALENNAKVQNAQLSLEAAGQTKKEAFTRYFPSVSATGFGFKANKSMLEMDLPLGAMMGNPAAPPISLGLMESGIVGTVIATQPVFAGGQIVNGNKLAKIGVEASELQKAMSDDEILLTTEQYFWQIVALEEKVNTVAETETLLNRAYTDVNNAYEAGMVNKNDLLKVELKQNELESSKLKLSNGLKLAKMVLAQLIGVAADGFDIDKTVADNNALLLNARTDHQSALSRRAEYQLLDKSIEAGKLQVRMEIGKNLPTVAVNAGWNYMNLDKDSPLPMKDNFWMGAAVVSIPISGWWGGSHAIKRQKLQVRIAENEKRNAEELLLIQMQQLWNELEESYAQTQLSEKTIVSALENVRLNEDYYKAGTGLLIDLLDAQSSLQQARDQYTEASIGYQMSLSKYRQATAQW